MSYLAIKDKEKQEKTHSQQSKQQTLLFQGKSQKKLTDSTIPKIPKIIANIDIKIIYRTINSIKTYIHFTFYNRLFPYSVIIFSIKIIRPPTIMLPNKPQEAFVYNSKTDQIDPINLIATDRVRCINCSKYYHHTEIQAHLMTHANQQFVQREVSAPLIFSNQGSNPRQPNILGETARNSKISTSTFDVVNEPIDVQTMTADELPQPQQKRRGVQLPIPQTYINGTQPMSISPSNFEASRMRTQSQTPVTNINAPIGNLRQKISVGDYFQSIELGQPQSIQVVPNTISLKRNINTTTYVDRDNHVDHAKIPVTEEIQQTYKRNTYRIITNDPSNNQNSQLGRNAHSFPGNKNFPASQVNGQEKGQSRIQVPEDNGFLAADIPRRINTTKSDRNRTNIKNSNANKVDVVPVTQRSSANNLNISRYTNNPNLSRNTAPRPQESRSVLDRLLPYFCGSQEPLKQQQEIYQPRFTHSIYQYGHNHENPGFDCTCPCCGGFYCPVCKSTVPPQYRRPPPYLLNQDYHLPEWHNHDDARTNNSGITPIKYKQM